MFHAQGGFRRRALLATALAVPVIAPGTGWIPLPTDPVVVTFPPGHASDVIGRIKAPWLDQPRR